VKRIFKLLISLGVYYSDIVREMTARIFGKSRRSWCTVLYYHEVPKFQRGRFAAQLNVICREATPLSALTSAKISDGKKYFAITVDDAFISFFENGLPELEQRNIPVVVFVPTGWLGRKVDWAMEEVMTSPDERIATLAELKKFATHPLVRFGSHTAGHRKLSGLTDAEASKELSESKEFLEREFSCAIDAVSFPYGGFTVRDLKLATQLGYKTFFTTRPTTVSKPGESVIGRFRAEPSDWMLEIKLKAAGAYRWQSAIRLRTGRGNAPMPARQNVSEICSA
jgi:peptidoglycan/xylan/chitin deacetylase (PgdA/CDA1 family)